MCGYKAVLETWGPGGTYHKRDVFKTIFRLKELLPEIGNALPELDGVVPCLLQSDHMNPLGDLQCSECNLSDF